MEQSEFPFAGKVNARAPLRIHRSQPLELLLSQTEASSIRPGEWVSFTGRMKFHPRRWGAVGSATDSQQLYTLQHEYLGGGFLGTFTSQQYQVEIAGSKMNARWAKAQPVGE